jgi:hypothetical protein
MAKPKDTLLKEAIADAKAIREAAIANARIVIEEAFAPQLSSMLSRKLRTELEEPKAADGYGAAEGGESDSKAVEEGKNPDSSGIGTGDNKSPSADAKDSSNVGSNPEPKTKDLSEELQEPSAADGYGSGEGGESDTKAVTENDDMDMDDESGDLDLEAVIRELEMDSETPDQTDIANKYTPNTHQSNDFDLDVPPAGEPTDRLELEGDDDLDFDVEDDEISSEPEQDFDAPEDEDVPDTFDSDSSDEMGDDDEIDLEEVLREIEANENAGLDPKDGLNPAAFAKVTSENANLKNSLREHREVIEFLREKLQEVNMLNAKLLYTNRIFKSSNLDLNQKQRVVETFDRATTIREVKLVYTTLAESFKNSSKSKNSSKIVEGFASKPTGTNTVTKNPELMTESVNSEFVARMKRLANIKN